MTQRKVSYTRQMAEQHYSLGSKVSPPGPDHSSVKVAKEDSIWSLNLLLALWCRLILVSIFLVILGFATSRFWGITLGLLAGSELVARLEEAVRSRTRVSWKSAFLADRRVWAGCLASIGSCWRASSGLVSDRIEWRWLVDSTRVRARLEDESSSNRSIPSPKSSHPSWRSLTSSGAEKACANEGTHPLLLDVRWQRLKGETFLTWSDPHVCVRSSWTKTLAFWTNNASAGLSHHQLRLRREGRLDYSKNTQEN